MSDMMPEYRELLECFVSLQTVSDDPTKAEDMLACAHELESEFREYDFRTELVLGFGNPIVFARYDAKKAKTALIYGHYDVQPAKKSEGWTSDPFVLDEREGKLYGRGTNDMKGLLLTQMVAAFYLIKNDALAYNLIFVIEGNEENDGGDMPGFIKKYREQLRCDLIITSDGQGMVMDSSLRGGFNVTVSAQTAPSDQHSGLFGGIMASAGNAIREFATHAQELVGERSDDWNNPLTIGLDDPPQKLLDLAPEFNIEEFKKNTGALLQREWTASEITKRLYFRPNIELIGFECGYTGEGEEREGYRPSVIAKALAKFNVRLAPMQPAREVGQRFKEWADETMGLILPKGSSWEVDMTPPENGVLIWKDAPIQKRFHELVEGVVGSPVQLRPCGASIPVLTHFDEQLGAPIISISFGNEGANIHGIDENISLVCIELGLRIYQAVLGTE